MNPRRGICQRAGRRNKATRIHASKRPLPIERGPRCQELSKRNGARVPRAFPCTRLSAAGVCVRVRDARKHQRLAEHLSTRVVTCFTVLLFRPVNSRLREQWRTDAYGTGILNTFAKRSPT